MLLQELKIVLRKLQNEFNYTLINLTGLTLGISFATLIYVYVNEKLSYDQHIPDAHNIYRVASDFELSGHRDIYSNSPRPIGAALVNEFPGILWSTKVMGYNGLTTHGGYLKVEDDNIYCGHLYAADSNFINVFQLPLLAGDLRALHDPNSAVISRSMAKKLFNKEEVLGESFVLENQQRVQVTGIFEDHAQPTYLTFEVLVSYRTFFDSEQSEKWWYGGHVFTYIRTVDGFEPADVYRNWEPFFNKYMKPTFDDLNGTAAIILQPLTDIFLWEEYIWEPYEHGNKRNLLIFSAIGVFLLLVASFNYTNLSLSQSLFRAKDVGIKKVLGSGRHSLIRNRILESLVLSWMASLLAVSLLTALTPVLSQFAETSFGLHFFERPTLLFWIFGVGTGCGLVASIYPALFESSFTFTQVFKTRVVSSRKIPIRKIFVLGQQMISVVLIICTLVVIDQINFVRSRDIGFDPSNLAIVEIKDRQLKENLQAFTDELTTVSGVRSLTMMDESPGTGMNEFSFLMQTRDGSYISNPSQMIGVGLDFIETMGLTLVAGRSLLEKDVKFTGVVINEFLAEKMGYSPDEAVGVKLKFGPDEEVYRSVVGVVRNFSMSSAQVPMKAMTISYSPRHHWFLVIRLSEKNQQEILSTIEGITRKHGGTLPFTYSFLSDELDSLLGREDRLYHLLILGSILIIFISCLGLLGLTAHSAIQKTKEIGIRKVVGAGDRELFWILTREFVKTYLWAFVGGSVLAWIVAAQWLSGYAYRVDFNWLNILIAGVVSFAIVLFTLSLHSLKIINSNNLVENLRYE